MAGPFQPAVVFTDRSLIAKIARTYENVGYPPKRNFMLDPPLNACAKTPPQSMRGRDAGRANLPGRTMEDDDPVSALFGACAALLGFSAGDPQGLAEDAHPAASGSRTEWHRQLGRSIRRCRPRWNTRADRPRAGAGSGLSCTPGLVRPSERPKGNIAISIDRGLD
jgi:hypothetical protein